MKKNINYYYNLFPTSIINLDTSYSFFIGNKEFYIIKYNRDEKHIDKIVEIGNKLYYKDNNMSTIIKCMNGSYYFESDNNKYVLLLYNNKKIFTINDIIIFNENNINQDNVINDVKKTWINKIDITEEKVFDLLDEYPIIKKSVNYFVGLAENAVSYINSIDLSKCRKCLSHNTIENIEFDFYNPVNIINDYIVRDISQYIKHLFFNDMLNEEEIIKSIKRYNFNADEYKLLVARLLYPNYYFNAVLEAIDNDNYDEKLFEKFILKRKEYISLLRFLIIEFKKCCYFEDIEWLIK